MKKMYKTADGLGFFEVQRLELYISALLNNTEPLPPTSRIELMMTDIINGKVIEGKPTTRLETYLAKISGADVKAPEPVTRLEYFLAKIAGMETVTFQPVTQLEELLCQWERKLHD